MGQGAYLGIILLASSAVEGQRLPNCAVSNCVKLLCRRSVLPALNQKRSRSNAAVGGLRTDNANCILRREFAKQVDVFDSLIEHTVRVQCCSISFPRVSSRGWTYGVSIGIFFPSRSFNKIRTSEMSRQPALLNSTKCRLHWHGLFWRGC